MLIPALRSVRNFLIIVVVALAVWLLPGAISTAQDYAIPSVGVTWENQYGQIPDWSQLTFRTLPPILSDGVFDAPSEMNDALNYDLSRVWQAGQTADTYLKLGDFQTSLYLQLFNLYSVAQLTQLDLEQVALGALEMVAWQSLDDLVTAIPGLGNFELGAVPPIQELISSRWPGTPGFNPQANDTIAELLGEYPELGQLNLGDLGDQLNSFAITDMPGLDNVPLQNFTDWGNSTLGGVPGLADVPFDQMPNPIGSVGLLGQVDVAYGPAEQSRQNTISGSYQAGFSVACETDCAHVELTANALHGKQWISGKYQEVRGGEGILGQVNGGKEPTGRHPFGKVAKVVVWDVDESTGTVSTALFFRICKRGIPDLGCTPYFIGPVPFLSYSETTMMLVGLLDG